MAESNKWMKSLKIIGGVGILSALLFSGCTKRPKEVLSEKKMVRLMADMQLTESYLSSSGLNHLNSEERENLGKGVLKAHGVTQEELDSTLSWYGRNMDDYTELFAKVDKEIIARREKIMKEERVDDQLNTADMLWPYSSHGVLSALGNSDAWILSLEAPDLDKGDVVEWSMRVSEAAQFNGVIGVEYSDGTSDANVQTLSGKQKYELRVQTDTGKFVTRIYGTIRLRENRYKPVFSDSIMLRRIPYDSVEYSKQRYQKHYGFPVRIKPKVETKDTVANDTLREVMPVFNEKKIAGYSEQKEVQPLRTLNPVAPSKPLPPKKREDAKTKK